MTTQDRVLARLPTGSSTGTQPVVAVAAHRLDHQQLRNLGRTGLQAPRFSWASSTKEPRSLRSRAESPGGDDDATRAPVSFGVVSTLTCR
jgi:hypothetical protein